jgi:hypothetical protein
MEGLGLINMAPESGSVVLAGEEWVYYRKLVLSNIEELRAELKKFRETLNDNMENVNNIIDKKIEKSDKRIDAIQTTIEALKIAAALFESKSKLLDEMSENQKVFFKEMREALMAAAKETATNYANMEKRVSALEKFRWYLIGAAATIGFMLSSVLKPVLEVLVKKLF